MSGERSKRAVKPPKKFEEIEDDKPQRQTKHIFRLLTKSDLTKDVMDTELFILWPDNAQWYAAEIIKLDLKTYIGTIEYTETEEEEKNVKVLDLVMSGEIAFKEQRPVSYKLKKGEVDAPDPTPQRSEGEGDEASAEESGEEQNGEQGVSEDGSEAQQDDGEPDDKADQKEQDMQDKSRHRSSRADATADTGAGSAGKADTKRSTPMSAEAEPSTPTKRARAEHLVAGKRQVLPTEKAMQLLRQGKAGSGDFPAADEASRKLLRSLMDNRAEAKQGTSGQGFYGAKQTAPKRASVAPKPSKPSAEKMSRNATLQARYVELIKGHLDKAVTEAKAAGGEGASTDTKALATHIDNTMHKHFGGYNEDFRGKMRSVLYNLKDEKNQDFRGKVLRGEISPTRICHMESHDMASEEQQEWRRKREEESLKNSVLDSAAAARFSTAAALEAAKEKGIAGTIDWRTSTLAGDENQADKKETQMDKKEPAAEDSVSEQPSRPVLPEGSTGVADPAAQGGAVKEESGGKPSTPSALEGHLSSGGATSLAATSSFDWAKIKERAREEAANAPAKTKFETFNDFGDEEEAAGQPAADVAEEEPEEAPLSAEAARWQAVPDLVPIIASCTGRAPDIWTGSVSGIAHKPLAVAADYLAGPADIAALLGQQDVHIKGRMPFDRVERFCEDLRHSRRRTCSVAIIRSEHGPKQEFTDAAAEYSSRGRCGISDISGGVEGYLVPHSDLAERLIKTAYLAEGRDLRSDSDGLPEELGTDQMLLLLVHLKDWGQHIMHTEQALQKSSPLHVASPEHALAERPSASPGHAPGTRLPGATTSPHHASASQEETKVSQGTPLRSEGQSASPAHAQAPLHASGPQSKAVDPRQRSADPRQRSADPRRAAPPAQAPSGSPKPQPSQVPAAAPAAIDFGALGALAQALGVGLSMPAPAGPQQGQVLQTGGLQSRQGAAPQYQQQQQSVPQAMQQARDSQPQYQQQPPQQPAWGQPGQPSGAQGAQQQPPRPQQLQHWLQQGAAPGAMPMQQQGQQGQPQQLPGPPPMQQPQQAWQPQVLPQPPTLAPPPQGLQSPLHGQLQPPSGQPQPQQLGQQAPHLAPGYPGGPPQHARQQQPPVQLPAPQPLTMPAGQLAGPPRPITLARPGQTHQQHAPRPQQPITLPPPGQQHAQLPPRPITLQAPAPRGPPLVQHPQQRPPQAPITLRPPGPITLKPPGGSRPPGRGGRSGRGGSRGRADGQGKPGGGRSDEGSGQPASKRPRVMGPGAKAIAGFQG